jgi:hypothetical protein
MTAAAYRYKQLMNAGKSDRSDNIRNPGTAHNQGREFVNCPVKHPAGGIVIIITRTEQLASQIRSKRVDNRFLKRGPHCVHLVICHACVFWLRHEFSLLMRADESMPKVYHKVPFTVQMSARLLRNLLHNSPEVLYL